MGLTDVDTARKERHEDEQHCNTCTLTNAVGRSAILGDHGCVDGKRSNAHDLVR